MLTSVPRLGLGLTRARPLCKFTSCKVLATRFPCNSLHTSSNLYTEEPSKERQQLGLQGDNLVQRLYNKLFGGVPVTKLRASGYILLTHCAQRTDILKFFDTFNMPDTFYSWFLVTELHVWLLGVRLMAEGDQGRLVRNSMVEALWVDCENRAKAIGDMSLSARSKQIAGVAEEFQAALFIYDEGLLGSDMQMANALWRRFFLCMRESEEDAVPVPDPEKLLKLVNYVRNVSHYLENLDGVEVIVKNELSWPKLE